MYLNIHLGMLMKNSARKCCNFWNQNTKKWLFRNNSLIWINTKLIHTTLISQKCINQASFCKGIVSAKTHSFNVTLECKRFTCIIPRSIRYCYYKIKYVTWLTGNRRKEGGFVEFLGKTTWWIFFSSIILNFSWNFSLFKTFRCKCVFSLIHYQDKYVNSIY